MVDILGVTQIGLEIFYAIAILVFAFILSRLIGFGMRKTALKMKLSRDTRKSANWIINLIIYSLAVIVSLHVFGLDVTALLAGIGIFALAVGFAAQQLLSNIIAGFMIILERPFKIGDMINFDDKEGWVENIGLRATTISTYDGNTVIIPNSSLVNAALVNITTGRKENLVSLNFLLKPETDVEKAIKKIQEIPTTIDDCLVDEHYWPVVVFVKPVEKIGQPRYNLEVLFWVNDSKLVRKVITEFTVKAKKILE